MKYPKRLMQGKWGEVGEGRKDSFHPSMFIKQTLSSVYVPLTSNWLVTADTNEEVGVR